MAEAKKRRQCAKCPWRVDVDPHEIPNGYCETKHRNLKNTIAKPGEMNLTHLNIMACHHSKPNKEIPCVGWLANQMGPGNNIGLRIAAIKDRSLTNIELVGEQHERFEDTLP